MRIIKKNELDEFLTLLNAANVQLKELTEKNKLGDSKTQILALTDPVEALAYGTIEIRRLSSELETLMAKLEKSILYCMGMSPSQGEDVEGLLNRINTMPNLEIARVIRQNNIVWED